MKVSLEELKALPQHRMTVDFKEDLCGLDAIKPVLGELTLIWSGSSLKMSGNVKTLLKLSCDRCLRPYFQRLSVDIEERFVPRSLTETAFREPQKELLKDDFFEEVPDDGVLDISDIVFQAVTLATPSYCFCGEDCPGPPKPQGKGDGLSASQSGAQGQAGPDSHTLEPVDPRWKNLKTLFPKQDSTENS